MSNPAPSGDPYSQSFIAYLADELKRTEQELHETRGERNRYRKDAVKAQAKLNRYNKLIPGSERIWNADRVAMEMHAEADELRKSGNPHADADGLDADALWLERLAYDLITLREAMDRAPRGSSNRKYDDAQWPRGPRP